MQVFKIGIMGSLGVILRYIIALILPGVIAITITNLLAVFLIKLTANLNINQKEIYHTGFLGGFSSLSTLMLLQHKFILLLANVVLGLIVYKKTKSL